MAQERGSAAGAIIVGITLLGLMFHCEIVNAATAYRVGDSNRWDFSVVNWAKWKTFKAGDTLSKYKNLKIQSRSHFNFPVYRVNFRLMAHFGVAVFNYFPYTHNVVVVDYNGYINCQTPAWAKVYTSGYDQIKLVKGHNYFICNFPGHCESGMKIDVYAE
ncbi:hypothetical protein NE237_013774 [Protea cynaroides]|uniref:Phytocyanin domain-containing protein n=1 Tax=Protea cynaroides TaxID=273540 RepID=A0A9Q0GZB4_9MAGN|nr:hypothetical protein NE237_013774 [Protea cynaroides]